MKKLHLICGICGCAEMLSFRINLKGGCDEAGEEVPAVLISCGNCSTLTSLAEHIKEINKTESLDG